MTRPAIAALLRLAFAVTATVAVAGCSRSRTAAPEPSLEASAGAQIAAGWTTFQPQAALLRLPDAHGRPIALRERRQSQGVVQEIDLAARDATGRNVATIAVHGEAAQPGFYPGKPSEAGIRSELASAFPGRTLRIVTHPRRNAFGPYGLAVSVGPGGQRCVYAWQWLDRNDRRVAETLGGSASWRVRICSRRESLDEIAVALDQIRLGAGPAADIASEPAQPTPTRPMRRRAPQKAAALPEAERSGTVAALPGPVPGGQRYLAAVPTGPRAAAAAGGVQAALDQSLPAEAYRGPAARAAQPAKSLSLTAQRLPPAAHALRTAVPAPD